MILIPSFVYFVPFVFNAINGESKCLLMKN